jgi:hypothetical protein
MVLIDKQHDIWAPKEVVLSHLRGSYTRLSVLDEEGNTLGRTSVSNVVKTDEYVWVSHYTSPQSLVNIHDSGELIGGVGCYGIGVYVTKGLRRGGESLLEIGESIFDGAGWRAATSGHISGRVLMKVRGAHLMMCNSRDPAHCGFVYKGGNKKWKERTTLEKGKGGTAKQQKSWIAKNTPKFPNIKLQEIAEVKYQLYIENNQLKDGWRSVVRNEKVKLGFGSAVRKGNAEYFNSVRIASASV